MKTMMRRKMRNFLKQGAQPRARLGSTAAIFPLPAPEQPLAVIGDVHGMAGLFRRMLERLEREAPQARLICVGDLVDRGEDSAQVLREAHARRDHLTVLMGNHEEMMIGFLDAPGREGARWLRNGGLQTLASFGIGGVSPSSSRERFEEVAQTLRARLGAEIEGWLRKLPRLLKSGNVVMAHAGADPWQPIALQPDLALTWGHPEFGQRMRTDGIWIVHGHTIVAKPVYARGVISVDTGAYAGGGLSAALISGESVQFLHI